MAASEHHPHTTRQPTGSGQPAGDQTRRMWRLERAESLRLLGGVGLGRVVFTEKAMPAIRPVNHLLDDGGVIIRTHLGAAVLSRLGEVVAYQADHIDPDTHTGWSVVVTGVARPVTDPELISRYEHLLQPWISGHQMDQVIRIEPQIVTGYALTGPTTHPDATGTGSPAGARPTPNASHDAGGETNGGGPGQ
ncbi:pyridoxamine 5'-phosphate oxidase family protein [Pseudonocardia eucalypti]|uniref:Pyridoxamine 5'-phosphate oxidase family protein n=1 Tax=Pseudonocardia eucalypti TaxID=648755 RepID=A0ABP9PPD0_9PSEU|nr:hypothetical protein [Pseudonocardia eucalypti]